MKKTIALLMSAVLMLTLFAACGSDPQTPADKTQTDAVSYEYTHRDLPEPVYIEPAQNFAGGTGSEADPYQISNGAELAFMGKVLSETGADFLNANYKLTADIELNDVADFDSWASKGPQYSWKTIDASNNNLVLDGDGHTISGLYINADNNESKSEYGLFGTFNGTIKNLKLDKSYISVSGNTCYIGALAAYLMNEAAVENCEVNATIDCYDNDAGGVVGYGAGGFVMEGLTETDEIKFPVIKNCTFNGTINQIKKESLNTLGGIAASGSLEIIGCTNNGTINFDSKDIDKVGGIIGMTGFGKISDCINNGKINGIISEDVNVAAVAGGIIGDAFQSATGTAHMSRGLTIENCINNAEVTAQTVAGGIAGSAANDNNEWCLTFKGCTNNGQVLSTDYCGGVIGELSSSGKNVNGDNIVIEDCINTAQIGNTTPGGIIGAFLVSTGDVVIRNCKNSGDVVASESQDAGGIIGYLLTFNDIDTSITVENCENSGMIESTLNAGGVFGWVGGDLSKKVSASSSVDVINCKNNGDIFSSAFNGFIGGIAGNWGIKDLKTTFRGCTNNGALEIKAAQFDKETLEDESSITLSRIVGGIVGRIGSGLLLTTDSDKTDEKNVNNKNAVIMFENCESTGDYTVSDEETYEYGNGKAVYENYFGGIVGNTCAEDGFSILVNDCSYEGFERGLGNADLPDVGAKK